MQQADFEKYPVKERYLPSLRYILHQHSESAEYFYHKHEDICELVYLAHGSGTVSVRGKEYPFTEGDLLLINQDAMHSEKYEAGVVVEKYVYGLDNVLLAGMPPNHLLPDDACPVIPKNEYHDELLSCLRLIETEYNNSKPRYEQVCGGVLLGVFALIARSSAVPEKSLEIDRMTSRLAEQVEEYLKVHYCENLSLKSVADKFYVSTFYLAHIMKSHLGIPMIRYVIRLRIGEAQNLLCTTNYPVKQISQMVGYANFNYFLNVFKKTTGKTPNEFRAQVQKKQY
ncbi:AraC family transcriptional regulator [Intestinibacillus massiliensis]|uniref:AraC family transcriptional regulator n=1 Tax=Intestinibacillus massiliensis TaxID=1871029 RepID=UPI000B362285|nr:AraC family transcriptional regulator [Intestinibacillus massiliensis]MCB6366766.1 AraC family transcriptional regulator [Intestinibacillus massiliensis]